MATHSSVLAWRIPGTAEPSGLPSMGLHRVGYVCSDLAVARRYEKFPLFEVLAHQLTLFTVSAGVCLSEHVQSIQSIVLLLTFLRMS